MTQVRPRRWSTALRLEIGANAAVLVCVPLLAHLLGPLVKAPAVASGLGRLVTTLSGGGGVTDIGGAATAAYGLWNRALSAYQPAAVLDAIGTGAYGTTGHTHPPSSIVLWSPLVAFDYGWWLSFWVMASALALAICMRVLSVPAVVAYPLALGICLTVPGAESLVTTYPFSALLLALAWRFRDRAGAGGVALGLFTAERGIGAILLLAPAVRRRWGVVLVAVAVVLGLTVLAIAAEPDVIHGFMTGGREWLAENLARTDLYTPYALFERRGLPIALLIALAAAWSVLAWWRGSELFWVLTWTAASVSPLAWHYSSIQLLPLAVVVWRSGAAGRAIAIVTGFAVFGMFPVAPIAGNLGWTAAVALLGVAIVAQPVGRDAWTLAGRATLDAARGAETRKGLAGA